MSPRSILLVVHALPPDEASGTPLVTYGYATALAADGWSVTVLSLGPDAPPWDELRVEHQAGEPFDRVPVQPVTAAGSVWTVDAPSQPWTPTPARAGAPRRADPADAVGALLGRLRPDVVHVVDNVHLPLSIPEVAHRRGIAVVRTVSCAEDLCALIAPVSPCSGPDGFCPAPITVEHCADCVASVGDAAWIGFATTGVPVVDEHRHRHLERLLATKRARAVAHFTDVYDRVVFASTAFRAYFERTLPLDPWRTRVVPMGVDLPAAVGGGAGPAGAETTGGPVGTRTAGGPGTGEPGGVAGAAPGPLRLLLAAVGDRAKGLEAVVDAFTHEELAGRDDWRLVLAGGGDRSLFGPLLGDRRVTDHGSYTPGELPGLLAAADVGLSTSVFETFHRVTREYLAAGLAVVGSGAFGITDVVVPGGNGLRFDHGEPRSLRRAVLALLDDRALVQRLQAGARATAIRSVADEVADLQALYAEVLDRKLR